MKSAIVRIAGKQYQVSENELLSVDHLDLEPSQTLEVTEVLLINDNDKIKIGQPFVDKAKVKLEVISQDRSPKIRVSTYKAKARQRKVHGHKQLMTTVKVTSVTG